MSTRNRSLTVRLTGLRPGIDAAAFIEVMKDTLLALEEINKQVSPHGAGNVEWEIVAAGMTSPLFATLQPRDTMDAVAEYGGTSLEALVGGVGQLQATDECPRLFTEQTLNALVSMTRTAAKGIAQIEFSSNGNTVVASKAMSENASRAIQKIRLKAAHQSGEAVEYGSIEGHLKELSEQSGRDKMVIIDDLTGDSIACYFRRPDVEQKGRLAWKHRVSVTGKIKTDRATGIPKSVIVDSIDILRGQSELPQIDDLNGIDITGGMETSEYIRGLRDAE